MKKLSSELTDFILFGVLIISGLFLISVFFPNVFNPKYKLLTGATGAAYRVISRTTMRFADSGDKALVVSYQPVQGETAEELTNDATDIVNAVSSKPDFGSFDSIIVSAHVIDRRIGFYTKAHNTKITFKKDQAGTWHPNAELSQLASVSRRRR